MTRTGAIGTCLLFAMTLPAATAAAARADQPATGTTTTTTAADPNRAGAKPPPLDPNFPLPKDTGGPDEPYALDNVACVSSLNNGKIVLHEIPWGQKRLQIAKAQQFTKGKTASGKAVTVAVIDTGVHQHKYFQDRLSGGGDYVKKEDNGLEDCDGHGTEVAGIIAGDPKDSSIGFIGVAPEAKIISIRQSSGLYKGDKETTEDPNDKRTAGTLATLAEAVIHAANKNVDVINMSVDNCRAATLYPYPISPAEKQLQKALHYAVEQKDVVIVSSAGNLNKESCPGQNNGPDPDKPDTIVLPPWFADDVISVAAVRPDGDPAEFSMHGPWVSVAAPGTDITSLDPATDGLANQTLYEQSKPTSIDGTSFAAPYVSGLAALVRARYPQLNARQVMNRIEQTAQHPAGPGGRDNVVGYGMINPVAALTQYIPSEYGVPDETPSKLGPQLPPPNERDWAPMQIALAGCGGGLGLLIMTLFAVHTVRRNRKPTPASTRR